MEKCTDVIGDAIKKTFSISSDNTSYKDAIKEIEELDDRIELIFNRIDFLVEDMTREEAVNVMARCWDTLLMISGRASDLRNRIRD